MTSNLNLVALTGYARSGKDTAAAALISRGWQRRAFADKLREFAYLTNPLIEKPGSRGLGIAGARHARLADLVDEYGWEEVKDRFPAARAYLQRLGTDAGRRVLGDNVWVDAALSDLAGGEPKNVVVTDCRFPNEANAVRALGGLIVRITRPGVRPVNAHASETAMDHYVADVELENSGTAEDLQEALRLVVAYPSGTTRR